MEGLQIIISSATWRLLDHEGPLLWRELDFANVKGKDIPVNIYEIFNSNLEPVKKLKQEILPQYHDGLRHYHKRHWDEALALFRECLSIYPDDVVSQIYVERCLQYKWKILLFRIGMEP